MNTYEVSGFGIIHKSMLPDGTFVPASQLTNKQKKQVRRGGAYKKIQGTTKKDRKTAKEVKRTWKAVDAELSDAKSDGLRMQNLERKGRPPVRIIRNPYSGSHFGGGRPGPEGQRRSPVQVVVGGGPHEADSYRHEVKGHATRRKPASAQFRLTKYPEKLWGDEARSDHQMTRAGRLSSGYRALSSDTNSFMREAKRAGASLPFKSAKQMDKKKKAYLKNMPRHYQTKNNIGLTRYQDVTDKLESIEHARRRVSNPNLTALSAAAKKIGLNAKRVRPLTRIRP